jgi:lysophospholipase L1-like esterase
VLDAVPTLVIWQNGGHAALREMDVAEFEALTRSGVREFRARGIDVILMDNQLAPRIVSRPGHALYDAVLARVAAETGVSLFSRAALMRDWAAAEPDGQPMIGEDNLHHTDRGYACVAAALAAAIEAAVPAATVHQAARPPAAPAR